MSTTASQQQYDPKEWGFNPISHHHVRKSGAVWKRLVKAGLVQDPELMHQLQTKADGRKKKSQEVELIKKAPSKSCVKRAAKLVASTSASCCLRGLH